MLQKNTIRKEVGGGILDFEKELEFCEMIWKHKEGKEK